TPRYLSSFPTRRSSDLVTSMASRRRSAVAHGSHGSKGGSARRKASSIRRCSCSGNWVTTTCWLTRWLTWATHHSRSVISKKRRRSEEHTSELQSLAYLV